MDGYLQLLTFIIIGVLLLWFGYNLFIGQLEGARAHWKARPGQWLKKVSHRFGDPGDPSVCPVCSSMLDKGDLVSTLVYPSITGGKDRLMHIRGCMYCINGDMERTCPVCGSSLEVEEILVARMFERPGRRPHVHVLGCSYCRRLGIM